MIKLLGELVMPSSSIKNQDKWLTWQREQDVEHFEKCTIMRNYLADNNKFEKPKYSCIGDPGDLYYVYCFGDFSALLCFPSDNEYIWEYVQLLLDIYEYCKGPSRMVKGDPRGIAVMKKALNTKSTSIFNSFKFSDSYYDYSMIHAHTTVQFSVSTLLIRLLAHYLGYLSICTSETISRDICFHSHYKGSLLPEAKQNLISVVQEHKTCSSCKRITENHWGKFMLCLDCNSKYMCKLCGEPASVTVNEEPRCADHENM